jgi:predicted glycogen debranching enzyme
MTDETPWCRQHHNFTMNTGEWLETDGLGGFASGTVSGIRTRRYHGMLLAATTPPTGRVMLVNGVEAWVATAAGRYALSSHLYQPGVQHPDGGSRLVAFSTRPWPTWTWELPDGSRIVGEVVATHGAPRTVMTWRIEGDRRAVLEVRPLMSGRDYHALHHENSAFRFEARLQDATLTWSPYDGVPSIGCLTNGTYRHAPEWFRGFLYLAERDRGLDDTEDLASPGVLSFDLDREAVCVWQAGDVPAADAPAVRRLAGTLKAQERRRRARFDSPLAYAAGQYLVSRGRGRTLVAGYPWFTDWGRDTFIAVRGLCLATGRLRDARDILLEWTDVVSEGMLPNRFPDAGGVPEYNSVDAALWFVVAARDLLVTASGRGRLLTRGQRARLHDAVTAVLEGYSRGTRYGIRMDADALLAAGERGQQLTWMDARVDGREITPRIGKPVEIQALWLNALSAACEWDTRWQATLARGMASFAARFWNGARGALFDVVDVDHRSGVNDDTLRPNQVLAVGGLPLPAVAGDRARCVMDVIERELWTPLGLRSLAPGAGEYVPHYVGSPGARDAAYHQGTVWPWLIGPFVDGWLRVRNYADDARAEALARFVRPLETHLDEAGLGHASEIADADAPYTPRGCPFQAWSLGELIRARQLAGGRSSQPLDQPVAAGQGNTDRSGRLQQT